MDDEFLALSRGARRGHRSGSHRTLHPKMRDRINIGETGHDHVDRHHRSAHTEHTEQHESSQSTSSLRALLIFASLGFLVGAFIANWLYVRNGNPDENSDGHTTSARLERTGFGGVVGALGLSAFYGLVLRNKNSNGTSSGVSGSDSSSGE